MRSPATESSSSMKMTAGAVSRARAKACRSSASPSPTYMECSCAPERVRKVAAVAPAAARASVVLQQPAGRCRKYSWHAADRVGPQRHPPRMWTGGGRCGVHRRARQRRRAADCRHGNLHRGCRGAFLRRARPEPQLINPNLGPAHLAGRGGARRAAAPGPGGRRRPRAAAATPPPAAAAASPPPAPQYPPSRLRAAEHVDQ